MTLFEEINGKKVLRTLNVPGASIRFTEQGQRGRYGDTVYEAFITVPVLCEDLDPEYVKRIAFDYVHAFYPKTDHRWQLGYLDHLGTYLSATWRVVIKVPYSD